MGGTSCQSRLIIWGRDWSAAWAVSVTARRGAVDAPGKAKQCGTVHGGAAQEPTLPVASSNEPSGVYATPRSALRPA